MNGLRIQLGALALAVAGLLATAISAAPAMAAVEPPCTGRTIITVAHTDDNLLFMNPRLQSEFDSERCVRTVFLTAGDAGLEQSYWEGREAGMEAAYAEMAGVPDTWTAATVTRDGHAIALRTLAADPRISILFMRLPDGAEGEGYPRYGNQSLEALWKSTEPTITAVDGSATYSRQELVATLSDLIDEYGPRQIWTQNYDERFGGIDHTDHVATALFTREAQTAYAEPHRLIGFLDYNTESLPANVGGLPYIEKKEAFYTYGADDPEACDSDATCEFTQYKTWLAREYVATEETHGVVANAGFAQAVAAGQGVSLNGAASSAEGGAPVTYSWTQTGGPSVALANPQSATPTFTMISHPTLLTFALTASSSGQTSPPDYVRVRVPSSNPTPTAVVGGGQMVASGSTVQLDGSESWDPNSLGLTYQWTQKSGPPVTLTGGASAKPEFVAPTGPTSLTFSLVVSNGTQHSAAAEVTIGLKGIAPTLSGSSSASFTVGTGGSVTLTAAGSPTPALSESGELPAGLTFVENGDGTATIAGEPGSAVVAPGSSRVFPLTVSATNDLGTATEEFTLTVVNPAVEPIEPVEPSEPSPPSEPSKPTEPPATPPVQAAPPAARSAPAFVSPDVAYGFVGRRVEVPVEVSGAPSPTISLAGSAPTGLALETGEGGKAQLIGTPSQPGVELIALAASNSAGTVSQQLRLVLEPLPAVARGNLRLRAGVAVRHDVAIGGARVKSVKCVGAPPSGVRCHVKGRRVVVTGRPTADSVGAYALRLEVTAAAGTVQRQLRIRVAP
jgi:LmbE family N-acetylglucosaminyl deacetylase